MNNEALSTTATKNDSKKYISNPFTVIFNGFSNLFKYNQTLAIILLVVGFFGAFGQVGINPAPFFPASSESSTPSSSELSGGAIAVIITVIAVIALIALPIIIFISNMYAGMAAYVALKTAQQKTVTFEEAWKATLKKFWTVLWVSTIVLFKVLGGFLLFIIPGVRAALRYNMVLFPVFDKNATAKQAIADSKVLTKDHLMEVFGMVTAAGLIPFVGSLMQIGGQSVMYPQLRELKASGAPKPAVHWLNYLGFILIICVLLLLSLLLLLFALI